jgi:hypothetical protein
MPQVTIRHTAPVWEETLVTVEVTEEHYSRLVGDDTDYELVDELLTAAVLADEATIQVTTGIDSMDADYEIKGVA